VLNLFESWSSRYGGHIPIQDKTKRSFEALSAIVYRPGLKVVDQHHREIINKSCALSAKDDELETMKRYVMPPISKG